jgi:hypothetical protein
LSRSGTVVGAFQRKVIKHRPIAVGVSLGFFSSVCLSNAPALEAFAAFSEHKDNVLACEQSLAVDGFQMFPLGVELDPRATSDEAQVHIATTTASLLAEQLQALTLEICSASNTHLSPDQSIKVVGLPMQMVHSDRTRSHFIKVLSTPQQPLEVVLRRYCEPR